MIDTFLNILKKINDKFTNYIKYNFSEKVIDILEILLFIIILLLVFYFFFIAFTEILLVLILFILVMIYRKL